MLLRTTSSDVSKNTKILISKIPTPLSNYEQIWCQLGLSPLVRWNDCYPPYNGSIPTNDMLIWLLALRNLLKPGCHPQNEEKFLGFSQNIFYKKNSSKLGLAQAIEGECYPSTRRTNSHKWNVYLLMNVLLITLLPK